ncbi:MAG: hypothetical protein J6S63_06235 [Atopobiaceae bacterium]|nr:hypothetical protein [Atopobiaceae bacterium]
MKTNRQNMNNTFSLKELGRKALTVLLTISMVSMNTPFAYAVEDGVIFGEPDMSLTAQSDQQVEEIATDDAAENVDGVKDASDEASAEAEVSDEAAFVAEPEAADETVEPTDMPQEQPVAEDALQSEPEVEVVQQEGEVSSDGVDLALALDHAYIHYMNQAIASPVSNLTLPANQDFQFAASADEGYEITEVKMVVDGTDVALSPDDGGMYNVSGMHVKDGARLVVTALGNAIESTGETIGIEEEVNTQDTFVFENDDIKVTAKLVDPSAVPAGVELRVTPVTKESVDYNYDVYMEALNKSAEDDNAYTEENTLLYDVAFMDGDKEVQLADGLVTIDFQFKMQQLSKDIDGKNADEVAVTHLPLSSGILDAVDSTADATNITADDVMVEPLEKQDVEVNVDAESASVTLESLSLIAITTTSATKNNEFVIVVNGLDGQDVQFEDNVFLVARQRDQWNNANWNVYPYPINANDSLRYSFVHLYKDYALPNAFYNPDDANGRSNYDPSSGVEIALVQSGQSTINNDFVYAEQLSNKFDASLANGFTSGEVAADISVDNGTRTATVSLRKIEVPKYTYAVDFSNADAAALATTNYYALATLTRSIDHVYWTEQANYYKLTKLDTSEASRAELGISKFKGTNNQAFDYKDINPNTDAISLRLFASTNANLDVNAVLNNSDCVEVKTGEQSGGNVFTVSNDLIAATPSASYTVNAAYGDADASILTGTPYVLASINHLGFDYYSLQHIEFGGNPLQLREFKNVAGDQVAYYDAVKREKVVLKLVVAQNDGLTLEDAVAGRNCAVFAAGNLISGKLVSIEETGEGAAIAFQSLAGEAVDHTCTVEFLQTDHKTALSALTDPAIASDLVAVARLTPSGTGKKGATAAWYIQPLDVDAINGTGTATIEFPSTGYNICNSQLDATGETTDFVTNSFDFNVEIYALPKGADASSYNSVRANGSRTIEGYTFLSNETNASQRTSTIKISKQYENELDIKLEFEEPSTISGDENYYVFVKLGHNSSTSNTYFMKKLEIENETSYNILADEWRNLDGNVVEGESFTGQTDKTEIYIVKSNNATLSIRDAAYGNNCRKIEENGAVGTYVAHYGDFEKVDSTGYTHHTYTKTISMSPFLKVYSEPLDYLDVLGNARYFGVTANEWIQYEAETNAAVKKIVASQQSGNDLVDYEAGEEHKQPWFVGEISGNLLVKGDAVDFYAPTSVQSNVSHESRGKLDFHPTPAAEVNAYIDAIINHAKEASVVLAQNRSNNGAFVVGSDQRLTIDTTSYGAGTIYIQLDDKIAGSNTTIAEFMGQQDDKLKIKKNADQTIVFTSNTAGDVVVRKFSVINNGVELSTDSVAAGRVQLNSDIASSIVWNYPNARSVDSQGAFIGIMLVPNGHFRTSAGVVGGWVIADKVSNPGVEIHNVWHNYDQNYPRTSSTIQARKRVDGASPADKRFSFELRDSAGTVLQTKNNVSNGLITFDAIEYQQEGTYTYTIVESEQDSEPGYTYDTTVHTATVTVTRSGDSLVSQVTYGNGTTALPVFNNTTRGNNEATGSITFHGKKSMLGRELKADETYTFAIYEGDKLVGTATNDGTGTIDYPKISYTQNDAGDHVYTVKETSASSEETGVTVDSTIYTVDVKVENVGTENLKITATNADPDKLDFTNTYAAEGALTFKGVKTVERVSGDNNLGARPLEAGETYQFQIDKKENDELVQSWTVTNDGTGKIEYPTEAYSLADVGHTYTYAIYELDSTTNHVTKSEKTYEVSVTVADGGNGVLTVNTTGDDCDHLDFVNTESYDATGQITLKGTKTLSGRAFDGTESYTIKVEGSQGAPMPAENEKTITPEAGTNSWEYSFGDVTYGLGDAGKEYTYTVSEVAGAQPGVTYSKESYDVKVTVGEDDGSGVLPVTVEGTPEALDFTNVYDAKNSVVFKGTKHMENRAFNGRESYTFRVVGDADAPMPDGLADDGTVTVTPTEGSSTADIEFGKAEFGLSDQGKTYSYSVTEVNGSEGGVTYDGQTHIVTIEVGQDDGAGSLPVTVTSDNVEALDFTNTYRATGYADLKATKTLIGRDANVADGEFKVELEAANEETKSKLAGTVVADVVKQGDEYVASFSHDAIEGLAYTLDDVGKTYVYTIKEQLPAQQDRKGVAYDETEYTATVNVVSDKGNGELEVTTAYAKDGEAVETPLFENTYDVSNHVDLIATKTLSGKNLQDDDFIVELAAQNDEAKAKLAQTAEAKVKKHDDHQGVATFSHEDLTALNFTKADAGKTFVYTMQEKVPAAEERNGVIYDDSIYTVEIAVGEDDNEGHLPVSVTYRKGEEPVDAVAFANSYDASGSVTLEARKTLNGQAVDKSEAFTFTVKDQAATDDVATRTSSTIEGGTVVFDAIDYSLDDLGGQDSRTFTYTIAEVNKGIAGYTYDGTAFTAVVTVTDDGDGSLEVSKAYKDATGNTLEEGALPTFANTYKKNGTANLFATKQFRDNNHALEGFEFKLEELQADGTYLQVGDTEVSDENGVALFDSIPYEAAGDHTYRITEVTPEGATITDDGLAIKDGVTYSAEVATVTVHVADEAGKSGLTVTYEQNGTTTDAFAGATFTNIYSAEGTVAFGGSKTLTGRDMAADEFSFTVVETDKDGNALANGRQFSAKNAAAANGQAGAIDFAPITYTLADVGTHYYMVSEVAPANGVSAITAPMSVTVDVEDNGSGALEVTASENAGHLDFANTYDATGEVVLKGHKSIKNRDFKPGDSATFTIEAVTEGAPMPKETSVTVNPTSDTSVAYEFGAIEYKLSDLGGEASKTFEYKVTESACAMDGVTKDGRDYMVSVTIADETKDGTLEVVASDKAEALDFTNTYAATGRVELAGTKTMVGRDFQEGDKLTFSVTAEELDDEGNPKEGAAPTAPGDVVVEPKAGQSFEYRFDAINYTLADAGKTYRYTVHEQIDSAGSVKNTTSPEPVVVHVSDDGSGALVVDASDNAQHQDFTNTYTAFGSIGLSGNKTITGRDFQSGDSATIAVEAVTEGAPLPSDAESVLEPTSGSVAEYALGTINFSLDSLEGAKTKTFGYKVRESACTMAGVTKDATEYDVMVTVTDDGDGSLEVTADKDVTKLDFTNTYHATGSVTFAGTKKLVGRDMAQNEFTFDVVQVDDEGNAIEGATVYHGHNLAARNDTAGDIAFDTISYTEADANKTYRYKVAEVTDTLPSSISATNADPFFVTVGIVDDGAGHLTATADYVNGPLEFVNTYTASGKAQLKATKTLNGEVPAADAFTFTLTDVTDGGSRVVQASKGNDATGDVIFDEITYSQADAGKTFTYEISEDMPADASVTHDTTKHTATVTVTDKKDGSLEAEVAYEDAAAPTFTNTKKAKFKLAGTKTIKNRSFRAGDKITLTVTGSDGAPAPANDSVTIEPTFGTTADFSFGNIEFDASDVNKTYRYIVTEVATMAGVSTEAKSTWVDLAVTSDKGVIAVTPTYAGGAHELGFTNTYDASGSITFAGKKTMDGYDLAEGAYGFKVTEVTQNDAGDLVEGQTWNVTNLADGTIEYPTITYGREDVGTHTYKVSETTRAETNDDGTGLAVDGTEYTVEVTVEDDGDGELDVVATGNANALNFSNTYTAQGALTLAGTKTLVGHALEAGAYSFVVEEVDEAGNVKKQVATGSNAAAVAGEAAQINYGSITYTLADLGSHNYVVRELIPNDASATDGVYTKDGVTYDSTQYHFNTVVTDDERDGVLEIAYDGDNSSALNFTNTYEATGRVSFQGTKELVGRAITADDAFTFSVYEGSTLVTTGSSTGSSIVFDPITYTQADAGMHEYTVTEDAVAGKSVTADTHSYSVTVDVADNNDGTLTVTPSDNYNALNFSNTYTASGEVSLRAKKELSGAALTAGQFSFQLLDKDGAVLDTQTNDASGDVVFHRTYSEQDLVLTNATDRKFGRFEYAVREVIPEQATQLDDTHYVLDNVVYDANVQPVVVVVTNPNPDSGVLNVRVNPEASEAFDSATQYVANFSNEVTDEADGKVSLYANKRIDVGTLAEYGDFEFTLSEVKNDKAKLLQTKVADKTTGKATFDAIEYKTSDIGKTFTYQIAEKKGESSSIGYDEHVETVTVVVSKQDGKLVATPTFDADGPLFANTYRATGSVTFAGTKRMENRALAEGETYSFQIAEKNTDNTWVATSDAMGNIDYPTIGFEVNGDHSDVGEHTYVISETTASHDGVTADTTTYEVTVDVADETRDGQLEIAKSGANSERLDFANTYGAQTSVTFGGTKRISGRDLTANDVFTFSLSENGREIAIATNDATGKINFPTINYTQEDAGTHTYTVAEKTTTIAGVTKADDEYTVTVEVADDGLGHLSATPSDNYQALDFVNTYDAAGSVTLTGFKTLEGRNLTAGDAFTFSVKEHGTEIATGRSGANGQITFTPINYGLDDLGTHTYYVTENDSKVAGVDKDATERVVTVAVSDNGDGTLGISTTGDGEALTFTNTYSAQGAIALEGTKVLTGRALTADDAFTFEVREGDNVVSTGTSDATGKIAFSKIDYTLDNVGDHIYTVRETSSNGRGVTVDKSTKTVMVHVSDNGDGTLAAELAEGSDTLSFTNVYAATGTVTFAGTKNIVGRPLTTNDRFVFEVSEPGTDNVWSVSHDATGRIAYPTIAYTVADVGEHVYAVRETSASGNGVTTDDKTYEVTVNVSDNGDGTLKVEASDNAEALDFTNTYAATGSVTFQGTKALVGRELTDDDAFTFQIAEDGTANTWTAKSNAAGKISYPKIRYTLADVGEHAYVVRETSTSGNGVTVDSRTYNVRVAVTDNGDGTLGVVASDNAQALDFVNTYVATGSVSFSGSKTLTGRDMVNGEFTFAATEEVDGRERVVATATNEGGKLNFSAIEYALADVGVHTYTVRETSASGAGVTKDNRSYEVRVEVTDNGDGTLRVEPSDNYDALSFTNNYVTSGEVRLQARKTVNGGTPAKSFEFKLTGPKLPEEGITATSNEAGDVTFDAIGFTQADADKDFEYQISEVVPEGANDGYTYDESVHSATVHVSDNKRGELSAVVEYEGDEVPVFDNAYAATGSVTFSGTKALTGRELTQDDAFTFTVSENGTTNTWTATSDATGKIAYPKIVYTLDDLGAHTYTVNEDATNVSGVTVDTNSYQVDVTVTDNGDGTLKAEPSDNAKALDFTNAYAAEGSVTFAGTKSIDGRALTADDAFTFQVSEDGTDRVWTATSDATGKIAYPTISYTLAEVGEHAYTVRETSEGANGITTDATERHVTVTVADNGDGTLKVEPSDNYQALDFTNEYAASGSVTFQGTKTLVGRSLKEGDVFTYAVKEGKKTVATGSSDASGAIVFDPITYTIDDLGEHTYTVSEDDTNVAGVTASTSTHTVRVNVTDNGDGTLEVEPSDNFQTLDFTNFYAAEGSVTFAGTKTLTGRDLSKADVFTFTVEEDGNTVATGKNDESGNISFSAIDYMMDDLGEHTYTVSEDDTSIAGVTKDANTYEVKVNVTDNGDGTLGVQASDNAKALDFTNSYAATGSVTFTGTKSIDTRAIQEGEAYTFAVFEGDEQVATATSDAKGIIGYPTIDYTLADVGAHTYTVRETSASANGVTVDANEYTVDVTVADNGDGTLAVDKDAAADSLDFTNAYDATGSVTFAGTKTLTGRDMTAGEFVFQVKEGDTVVATGTNAAAQDGEAGAITFDTINYTLADAGRHTYTVSEVATNAAGTTYDSNTYEVRVNVSDKGDGTLRVRTSNNAQALSFSNTYESSNSVQFQARKLFNGRTPAAGAFAFRLTGPKIAPEGIVATNDENGLVDFGSVTFDQRDVKAGSFEYHITEVAGSDNHVVYDDADYTATVTVAIGSDGKVQASAPAYEGGEVPTFANTSTASFELKGTKSIHNRAFAEGDAITFEVSAPEGAPMPKQRSITINPTSGTSADFSFGAITYGQDDIDKTYTYTITESANMGGVTNDAKTRSVSVAVTDEKGALVITPTYSDGVGIDFSNTYDAAGSVTFAGTKTLQGRAMTDDDAFSFEVSEDGADNVWTATSGADGAIAYPTIEYGLADVGTHAYTVRETSAGGRGVTTDGTTYHVTVEVADNGDGTLAVSASDEAASLDFSNTYEAAGSVTFAGTKTLEGRAFTNSDVYTFEVAEQGTDKSWTAHNDVDGTIGFPTITYGVDDLGDHTYIVREAATDNKGVTSGTAPYTVTVNVADNGDGTLAVSASDNAEGLDFANTYAARGDIALQVTKQLDGSAPQAGQFYFQLWEATKDADGNFVAGGRIGDPQPNDADGTVTFPALGFTQDDLAVTAEDGSNEYRTFKKLHYLVTEVIPQGATKLDDARYALGNVIYDATAKHVVVNVTDFEGATTADGAYRDALQVSVDANSSDDLTFNNATTDNGEVVLQAHKSLAGGNLADFAPFSFTLTDVTDAKKPVDLGTAQAVDGIATFDAIAYKASDAGKTFTYQIAEVNDGREFITYDDHTETVTVSVAESDGKVVATPAYDEDGISFTNTYTARGRARLQVAKTLRNSELADGAFAFTLTGDKVDGAQTVTNKGERASFKAITFTQDDLWDAESNAYLPSKTFVYQIAENHDAATRMDDGTYQTGGVSYDNATKTVNVTVTDNHDGTLGIAYDGNDKLVAPAFTNTYDAKGSVTLGASKTLNGAAPAGSQFSFALYEGEEATGEPIRMAVNEGGAVTFDPIDYQLAQLTDTDEQGRKTGTFTYTMVEVDGGAQGYTYDDAQQRVTVTVVDNGDGTLTATPDRTADQIVFANSYEASGTAQLFATKTLNQTAPGARTFEFQLAEVVDGEEKPLQTVRNDELGQIVFDPISYQLADAGVHTYAISEVIPQGATKVGDNYVKDGITYDGHVVQAQVNVTDAGNGRINVTYGTGADATTSFGGAVFANAYDADATLTLAGRKVLEGREFQAGDSMTFSVTAVELDADGNAVADAAPAIPAPVTIEPTEGNVATIAFDELAYSLADAGKTYRYTVTESINAGANVAAEQKEHTVDVSIVDNGDGTLSVTPTYSDGAQLEFQNTYEATGTLALAGTKSLVGRALTSDDVFTFEVLEGDKVKSTGTNDETGKISFADLTYTLDDLGDHTYTVREAAHDGKGIAVDTTSYEFMAHVADNGDGTLAVTTTGDDPMRLNFSNVYSVTEEELTFKGTKTLEGRELTADDVYTFEVREGDNVIATVTNDETGAIAYPTITYGAQDVGEHIYSVRETSKSENGVMVDTNLYEVVVNVTDNGDGTLGIEASDEAQALDFTNTYRATASADVEVSKTLNRSWKGSDVFTFELSATDDVTRQKLPEPATAHTTMASAKDESKRVATFDHEKVEALNFTQEDVGNTYKFLLSEVKDGAPGITYDTTMYNVTIAVLADNGDGTLQIQKTYTDMSGNVIDELSFSNTYEAKSVRLGFAATKTLVANTNTDRALERGEYEFVLRDAGGTELDRQTNGVFEASDGTKTELKDVSAVKFEDIEYKAVGDYVYSISEVIPESAEDDTLNGVVYDTTTHYVQVHITDSKFDGQLDATYTYDNIEGNTTAPEFKNTYFGAEATISFDKYFYGADTARTFEFLMVPADENFRMVRARASAVTLTQGEFRDNVAEVVSDPITYQEPGTYRYIIYEQGRDLTDIDPDDAQIRVTVDVAEDATTTVAYQVRDNNGIVDVPEGERPALYNNGLVSMSFRSRALRSTAQRALIGSFEPAVRKVLRNGILHGGEFQFAIFAGAEAMGEPMQIVTNDANGRVSFDSILFTSDDIGSTYTYTIVEIPTRDDAIVYDANKITLDLAIGQDENGAIQIESSYSAVDADGDYSQTADPVFVNAYDTIVIHTVKRSREENEFGEHDGLPGAHYGLWMVNPDGEDVYMGLGRNQLEETGSLLESDENGNLYYDIPMLEGVAYYFLEEWPPPAGHLVDPYPTDYFTIVHEDGTFRIVYETESEFATYCPGVAYELKARKD